MQRFRRMFVWSATFSLIASFATADDCDRRSFGSFVQENYKDTRARVLEARATGPISYRIGSGGRYLVESGSWIDPYTGAEVFGAENVHIDHLIPVCWAWERGASDWSDELKRSFYNDESLLMVVEKHLNLQKGDKGPTEWLPINRKFACAYQKMFLSGVEKYNLLMSDDEASEIEGNLELCEN